MVAGENFTYVGVSSRSGYERAINHLDDYKAKHEDSHIRGHALTHHGGRMDLGFKFVIAKTFQKALTRQISDAVRTRKMGEDLILNKKGVFNRCAVPELAVKYKNKMWKEERSKFEAVQERPETESCIEDMIAAREEGKKRKKEMMEIKAGKRRKKEVWCGDHGEIPWAEAGSSCNGKDKRKFL